MNLRWSVILGMGALGFVLLGSYAMIRPATESLFLEEYTRSGLPWVWLAVAAAVTLTVAIYNKFAGHTPIPRLMAACSILSTVLLLVLVGGVVLGIPHAPFLLYVAKDVYIVVLIEVFWTLANTTFAIKRAKWLYGLFLFCGAMGGIAGNTLVGLMAQRFGTEAALAVGAALLLVVGAGAWMLPDGSEEVVREPPASWREGLQTFAQSKMLPLLLALILVTQFAITYIDYDFNAFVEQAYPDKDARTAAIAEVYRAIDVGQMVLQLSAGVAMRLLGVGGVLLVIPLFLGGAVTAFLLNPSYGSIAVAKVASKVFDYSLFRAAKEIVYIPLSTNEKTQGKAIVDIFGYRVAKGGVSVTLLALGGWATGFVSGLVLGLILAWVVLTVLIVRRHRRTG